MVVCHSRPEQLHAFRNGDRLRCGLPIANGGTDALRVFHKAGHSPDQNPARGTGRLARLPADNVEIDGAAAVSGRTQRSPSVQGAGPSCFASNQTQILRRRRGVDSQVCFRWPGPDLSGRYARFRISE